jgi:hypothetical protein
VPWDETIGSYTGSYQYNELGQQVYQKDSQGKEILCTYNHDGKMLSQTERKAAAQIQLLLKMLAVRIQPLLKPVAARALQ